MKLSKVFGVSVAVLAFVAVGFAAYADNGPPNAAPPPGVAMEPELTKEQVKAMMESMAKERNARIGDEFGSETAKKIIAVLDKYEIDLYESFSLRREVMAVVNPADRTLNVDDAKAKVLFERIENMKKNMYEKTTKRNAELLKAVGGKDALKFVLLEAMISPMPSGRGGPGGPGSGPGAGLGAPGGPGSAPGRPGGPPNGGPGGPRP